MTPPVDPKAQTASSASATDLSRLIEQAMESYDAATEKLRQGDFAGYGEDIQKLRDVLEELSKQAGAPAE